MLMLITDISNYSIIFLIYSLYPFCVLSICRRLQTDQT